MKHSDPRVGIRSYRNGWQAYIRIDGRFISRTFPRTATRAEMQAWRQSQRTQTPDSGWMPPNIEPHQVSEQLKAKLLTLAQEAIRDQANGKGATLKGFHARLYPPPTGA